MKRLIINPFRFGDPVDGDFYLPRPELNLSVRQFLENRIHVILIGPRRFGKTSFVMHLLNQLSKNSYSCLFVDIFNITSHRDFLHQLLRAINAKKGWLKKVIESVKTLRPKISADIDTESGQPSFGLSISHSSEKDVKEMIQDVLEGIGKLGDQVIFAIDEFQKIAEIGDDGWLEATIRTHMQQLRNTSFLFTGSRRRIIYDMINNQNRPLYRSCQPIEFPSFGTEFTDWVVNRFAAVGIECQHEAIEKLRKLVQETPNYVQMVCFHLVSQGISPITVKDVEEGLVIVAKENVYTYQTLLNSLTPTQQRSLRLAAKEQGHIFSKNLLEKYEISSGPALSSAIKSLKDKGILDDEGTERGKIIFDDPLFAFWLKISFH